MNNISFIMVSPARNEEEFLPRVIKSVNKSSVRPTLWVIVDDSSTDETPKILQNATKEHQYIKTKRLNNSRNRSHSNAAYACKVGFKHAIQLSHENKVNWEYVVVLDADTIVERNYFEDLINKMEKNPEIGIASGDVHILKNGKVKTIKCLRDQPSGTARVLRRACFYEIDGYSINPTPDSVSTIKANLKGWKTVRFRDLVVYQLRETSSPEGLWKGHKVSGEAAYQLYYPPLLVLAQGLRYIIKPKFYLVIPYFIGYLESMIRKKPRIDDDEIVQYYKKEKLKEVLSNRRNYIWN